MTIDTHALDFMRNENTGVCSMTGKSFRELESRFLVFGDETRNEATGGKARIIGDKEKKKHEKNNDDSRVTMTTFRSSGPATPTATARPPSSSLASGAATSSPTSSWSTTALLRARQSA